MNFNKLWICKVKITKLVFLLFHPLQNTRVCTYCVEFNAWPPTLVSNEVCEMTKPETCEKPTDLKEADCVCDATRSDE